MSSKAAAKQERPASRLSTKSDSVSEGGSSKSEQDQKAPWKTLFFFTTKANLPIVISAVICSIACGAVMPIEAFITGKIFDGFSSYALGKYTATEFLNHQKKYVIYQVALSGASWVFHSCEFMLWLAFGELQAKSARDRLFHGLLEREIEWYDMRKNGIGALLPRLQTQIRDLQLAVAQPLGMLVCAIAQCILSLAEAFFFSWKLTLVTLASAPLLGVAITFISARMQVYVVKQQEKLAEAQKYCLNAFGAIETVKCFNGQGIERHKYMMRSRECAQFYFKVVKWNGLMMSVGVLLTSGMIVQGFYYGGVLIRKGEITPGTVVTCFFSAIGAFSALQLVMPHMMTLEKGRAAGLTLRAVMAEMDKGTVQRRPSGLLTPLECRGEIEVRNAAFAYPARPDQLALDNVSMFIPSGEMTFLIGKSGSGKSTLSQLLMRFYSASQGQVLVDGIPVESLRVDWLRSNVTLVEQQSLLFNDTVFQNIAFGKEDYEDVTKSEVLEAAEFALLQLMISDMPKGLDTMVGHKGGTMSGGQRQRMALARARLRDTPILMLDESTSALDYISRQLMMDAIRRWRHGKTTIVITHDIAQILPDDYVFVLEHGKLVQEGYRKHLAQMKNTPFQDFLAPDEKALICPFDSRKGTAFNSIHTRGSSLDSQLEDEQQEHVLHDPLEARLDASESNKRVSLLPAAFTEGSPVPFMGAFGGMKGAGSPWMRLAQASTPPSTSPVEPARSSWLWDTDVGSKPTTQRQNTQDTSGWSTKLEQLVERTGKRALDARKTVDGVRRRRVMRSEEDGVPLKTIAEDEEEKPAPLVSQKEKKLTTILVTIWPVLDWKYRILMLIGFYGCSVHAAANPVFSFVLAKLVSTFSLPGNQQSKQLLYSMMILLIAFSDAFHCWLLRFLLGKCGQIWTDNYRERAMERLLDQPKAFFDKQENAVSHLSDCLDRYAEYMRELLGIFTGLGYIALLMCFISVVWAIATQWKMALIALASAPYIFGTTRVFASVSGKWESLSNDAAEDASAIFMETFTNIKTVRALTLELHFRNKYITATNHALVVGVKRSFYTGFFFGVSDSAGHFAQGLVLYIGSWLASKGTSVNSVIQVAVILTFAIVGIGGILECIPQIGNALDAASRFLRLSKLEKSSHEHLGDTRIETIGEIVFDNLRFAYPSRPEQLVLKDINLRIQPGTCTAIVGGSGSGKSTIAYLLLDIWSTTQTPLPGFAKAGELTIGGRDVQSISTPALRSLIVSVSQTPTLFAATVAENIAYGLPEESPHHNLPSIIRAAKQAGIHDFITSLAHGYNTLIGDGGMGLSGGQAQRVAIARALVRQPSVLILDEATSALDVESADLIRQTIKDLVEAPGRALTVIIITHSRNMMEFAEHIVVLDQGQIVEEGEFEELVMKGGALTNLLSGGEWDGSQRRGKKSRARGTPKLKEVDWRAKGKAQRRQRMK
ncbi:putative ABC transporter [Hortaea werneckii]|nr:putative ABC transporter [Hortaea werneckii]KAI7303069.1 putative ABC transporter [Hortaea werneckii]